MITSGSVTITATTPLPVKLYTAPRGVNGTVVINGYGWDPTNPGGYSTPQIGVVIGDSSIHYDQTTGRATSGVVMSTPFTVPDFTGDLWVWPEYGWAGMSPNQEVVINYTVFDTK